MRDMQKYIDDCDRRIDTAQRRLEKTPDEIRQTNNLVCVNRCNRLVFHMIGSAGSNSLLLATA